MDITQLKSYLKKYYKFLIIICFIIFSLIGFNYQVKAIDNDIAISLINDDLLTRSIDIEYYIIDHKMKFDEKRLISNIEELYRENNIKVPFSVIVKENKVTINIGKEQLEYEIINNSIN